MPPMPGHRLRLWLGRRARGGRSARRRWPALATALTLSTVAALLGTGLVRGTRNAPGAGVLSAMVGADGSSAGAASWRVVGLGDSVTSGYHCDCTPFVQQYATLTAQASGRTVSADNLGEAGLTTAGLLDQLSGSPAATDVAGADIVLVTIGANDVVTSMDDWAAGRCDVSCLRDRGGGVGTGVRGVLDRIRSLRGARPTEILVTTYWNVVLDGEVARETYPSAYQQASDALTRAVNASIGSAVTAAGAQVVDLYAPFKGDGTQDPTALLAADGDHPDAAGHALIARTLAEVGWHALGGPAPAPG